MKNTKVVSVVMPVYNGEAYVYQAMASVMLQNIPLELIVVNDCSSDGTEDVIRTFMKEHPDDDNHSIIYIKNSGNLGASGSRNAGIKKASAAWIAFLDADDCWEEGKLEAQMALLEKTGSVLCCTARALVESDGQPMNHVIHVKSEISYNDLLYHNSITCSSVVVKKEAIMEFPMCHEDSHEDYISWLQILKKYGSACAIDEPLVKYRMSKGSKSGNKLKSAGMTFKVYRYMGFGMIKSIAMFISYAVHGVMKYTFKG